MADDFDGRIKNWIGGVVQAAEISLAVPDSKKTGRGVGLYLLEVVQLPTPTTSRRRPLQLALRYLITAWADKPEEAHQMLVDLIFAAMDNGDFQVEPDPIPMTVWAAFGVPPRPSFIMRVPLRHERPERETKLVRHPLTVQASPIVGFHGVLLGPGNIPLSDCRVEIPAQGLSTNTDYKGRFHFPAVPADGKKQLLVKAKGFELPVSSDKNYPDRKTPLVIHFSPLEG